MKKRKPLIVPGVWWALVRGPRHLPVLFHYRQDAIENRDADEYVVKVRVTASRKKAR